MHFCYCGKDAVVAVSPSKFDMKRLNHAEKVDNVCGQIKALTATGRHIKLQKEAVSHLVPNPYDKSRKLPKVNIKPLNRIIKIDKEKMICIAEPGVTFVDLVKETMKHDLIPYTVPELKTITLGGAISGCSIESMSYRHGGFHDSCIEYEVITAKGDVIICSPEKNSDIFHMLHGSYGTLGIITKITFKLLSAKPYVKMSYIKFKNFEGFWSFLKERCGKSDYDFIDAIIHSRDNFVVCLGRMIDKAPYLNSYDWLKIFYKSTAEKKEDYLKLPDYLFRYDTECHWLTKTVPLMETRPARLLFGKFVLGSTNLIKWSKRLRHIMRLKKRPEVVVDVFIPHKKFGEFFDWYKNDYDFFPLWIVPYKAPELYPWIGAEHARGMDDTLFIDCAVYGKLNNDPDKDYSEILEKKTIELGGIKTLISRNHFDKETFWKVYNRNNYDNVKKRTDPDYLFNDLYKKFHP